MTEEERILLGGEYVTARALDPVEGIEITLRFSDLLKAIRQKEVRAEHFEVVVEFVAACSEKEPEWIRGHVTAGELSTALFVFAHVNGMLEGFQYLEALGWFDDA